MKKLPNCTTVLPINRLIQLITTLIILTGAFAIASQIFASYYPTYPVAELDYCRDQRECYLYCEVPKNKAACWSYKAYILDTNVLGEQDQMNPQDFTIEFPIAELGNCNSIKECRSRCADPKNITHCIAFAKKKGFYKQSEKLQTALTEAQNTLGCANRIECKAACDIPENRDVCKGLIQRHKLFQHRRDFRARKLKQAKEILGCSSIQECKNLCRQDENKNRCRKFLKRIRMIDRPAQFETSSQAIPENVDPTRILKIQGECDSVQDCKAFCMENPDKCPGFIKKNSLQPINQNSGFEVLKPRTTETNMMPQSIQPVLDETTPAIKANLNSPFGN